MCVYVHFGVCIRAHDILYTHFSARIRLFVYVHFGVCIRAHYNLYTHYSARIRLFVYVHFGLYTCFLCVCIRAPLYVDKHGAFFTR